MRDFIIEGQMIRLIPLNEAGIEERVIWNTTVIEWKTEENGMIAAQSVDENAYRLKKRKKSKLIEDLSMGYIPRLKYIH